MKICVYCGSLPGDEKDRELARCLGVVLAQAGIEMVYGGGNRGLMGVTASSVLRNGGKVTGVMPYFLEEREGLMQGVENIRVQDMHERKRLMLNISDGFVVIPGGIGTLEEFVETLSWRVLGIHSKPIVLIGVTFWSAFQELISRMSLGGYIYPGMEKMYSIVETPMEAIETIAGVRAAAQQPDRLELL